MFIMKLTPLKTVAESFFKRNFPFDILSLKSWKEQLCNSTLTWQIIVSREICNLKFKFSKQNHKVVISNIH